MWFPWSSYEGHLLLQIWQLSAASATHIHISVFFFIKILIHIYMKKTNYRKQSWYLNNCDKKDGKLSFCQRFPHAHPPSMPKRHKMVWTEELAILVQKPGKNQVKPQLGKFCEFCLCGLNSSGDSHSIGSERNLESMPSMKNYSLSKTCWYWSWQSSPREAHGLSVIPLFW